MDNNKIIGGNSKHIIKPIQQLYREAEMKIGELERESAWLKNRLAYLLVAVNALGRNSGLSPEEAKKVVDNFIAEQEVELQKQVDVAKEKFKQDLANGVMPEFKVVENPDKTERG